METNNSTSSFIAIVNYGFENVSIGRKQLYRSVKNIVAHPFGDILFVIFSFCLYHVVTIIKLFCLLIPIFFTVNLCCYLVNTNTVKDLFAGDVFMP